ncbi:hypothetical protein [Phaeodactylibacter xiamenensis]|jgi:hypothetical protein|uniref:DUF2007 domain-containing protein n=1 Tax=Phaeodactylibacter xiamenensis TaxID=1524460 RepID=A0A098SDY1_9BACT|nr:hypothetical protein [Phaeodactylibacter xiamenensis]KGE89833.1 hypothetical protein IX84_00525 [Phaeodactylibacter xiamenensis]MCR9053876.1 hypothetical protein [bacterium]
MKEDWVKVFESREILKTKLVEDALKQQGVESHILERPDSAIPSLGAATLYAPQDKAQKALEIIRTIDFSAVEED